MLSCSCWVIAFLFLLKCSVQASDHNDNIFITPPGPGPTLIYAGNPIWALDSTQTISWITNLTSYRIELWQQGIDPGYGYSISRVHDSSAAGTGAGSHSISWDVDLYTSNLTFSPVYFFWLNPNTPEGFTSHYFNISADAPSSDTVVTSTSANGDKVSPVATTASLISASTSALSTTNEQQQSDPTETTTPLILKVASTSAIENELPSATTTAGLLGASTSALSITNEQQQNYPTETTTPLIPEIASMSADGNEIFPATTTAESIGASNSALPTTANEQQRNHLAETTMPLSLKIGMGIGIGLGVPLLVAAGAFIGIRLQRRRKEAMPEAASYETMPPYDSPRYHEPFPIYQLDGQSKRISVYQLSDRGDTPRMFSRAELG